MRLPLSHEPVSIHTLLVVDGVSTLQSLGHDCMDINTFRAIVVAYALLPTYNGRVPFLMNFEGRVLLPKPLL